MSHPSEIEILRPSFLPPLFIGCGGGSASDPFKYKPSIRARAKNSSKGGIWGIIIGGYSWGH